MSAPDTRRTAEAVHDVRAVWREATMLRRRRADGSFEFNIYRDGNGKGYYGWLACGDTPKQAWWNAREKALAHALTR